MFIFYILLDIMLYGFNHVHRSPFKPKSNNHHRIELLRKVLASDFKNLGLAPEYCGVYKENSPDKKSVSSKHEHQLHAE